MHRIETRHRGTGPFRLTLTLPFDKRQKSRLRAQLSDGSEVFVELPRGTALRHGELLETTDGVVVQVHGSAERVSIVTTDDGLLLTRAAYHLGNRHVPLQIAPREVSYLHDHVLDEMVQQLGLSVRHAERPFEPEPGAYAHGHAHTAGHGHLRGRGRIHDGPDALADAGEHEHHPHEHQSHEHQSHEHQSHEHQSHEHHRNPRR